MRNHGGFTLAEALVVLFLTAVLAHGGWSVLATVRRSCEKAAVSAERLETVRTVAWVLGQELGGGRPYQDWWPGDGDTLGLRAYRGIALAPVLALDGVVHVCFRGMRAPNPAKDSVAFLSSSGSWTVHGLVSRVREENGCMAGLGGWMEMWVLEPVPGESVFGRLYERGSYHLVDGALRYRRGAGGRQPLTPARIADGTLNGGVEQGREWVRWSVRLADLTGGGDTLRWAGRVR
jgi:hypothetical protein